MTPSFTLNLLRALFVVFCATIGAMIAAEILDRALPGILIGLLFGLVVVLIDRTLKGISLRAFSSATLGLLLGLFFTNLLIASDILHFQPESTSRNFSSDRRAGANCPGQSRISSGCCR